MHGTASSRSSDANPARDGAEDEGWKIVDDDEGGSNAAKLASVSCNASMDVDTIAVPAVSDELEGLQPVIEIAFKNGMWWCLPEALSKAIYETSLTHDVVSYIWDWGDRRPGSWKLVQWDGSEDKNQHQPVCLGLWEQNADEHRQWTLAELSRGLHQGRIARGVEW